jgi:uncharacterized Zn finger protein (UPF0148 family)
MRNEMTDTGYECKECGAPVAVADGKIIRSCDHNRSVVVAVMTAVATGESTLEQE